MKDAYEVLRQKEADVARVRHEIESLKFLSSLLSDELLMEDARELLQQKEADVAHVRHEVESLKIVAPLLWEELPPDELTKKRAPSAAVEVRDSGDRSEATGTEGLFSSVIASPRPTLWELLRKRKK
jgi:hypothetical protein